MKKLNTRALAHYLNVTKRTVQRRAIKENWPFDECIGLGGTTRLYDFEQLPKDVKAKIVSTIISSHEQQLPNAVLNAFERDIRRQYGTFGDDLHMDNDLCSVAQEVLLVAPDISPKRLREHFKTFFADKTIPDELELRRWIKRYVELKH